jgi:hypothetical protein
VHALPVVLGGVDNQGDRGSLGGECRRGELRPVVDEPDQFAQRGRAGRGQPAGVSGTPGVSSVPTSSNRATIIARRSASMNITPPAG